MQIDLNTILTIAGAITAVGGAWATIQQIALRFKRKRAAYRQAILDQARAEIEAVKEALEAKITQVEEELESQKENVSKDLAHIKETYSGEIRNLGEQIRELRSDLQTQHANLVSLLTRLVDSR